MPPFRCIQVEIQGDVTIAHLAEQDLLGVHVSELRDELAAFVETEKPEKLVLHGF